MAGSTTSEFNLGVAREIAAELGCVAPWKQGKLSTHFAYFADDKSLLIVAGESTGADAGLALAYGLTWRGDRRLRLALPSNRAFATMQRSAWLTDDARPEIYLHDGERTVGRPVVDPDVAVQELIARIPHGRGPAADLRSASAALHLGRGTHGVTSLTEWATRHRQLDPAHRQSYRAWHCMGLSVLQINRAGVGTRIRAGISDKAATASITIDVKAGQKLSEHDLDSCKAWVEKAIAVRAVGGLSKPDEHWLQAVLRTDPQLAGVEQPGLREVPAWRPPPDPAAPLSRGYVDLLGLDGDGDIRVVETKLTANSDPMLVLQGLDYYTWALAYGDALRGRLGASAQARITLCFLNGSTPDGKVKVSPYSQAQVDAIRPDVPTIFTGITDWFAPAQPGLRPRVAPLDNAALPT